MNKNNDGIVYTKAWVVNFMLDIVGYLPSIDLTTVHIVEPSCGEGSFVIEIIRRLCQSVQKFYKEKYDISGCIAAFDNDHKAIEHTKTEAYGILLTKNYTEKEANELIKIWFHESDYIESDIQGADIVIGNPPYIRATDLSRERKDFYKKKLDTFTMGTDIYVAFIEKGLKMLAPNGKLCYICSDRWQKNKFGSKLRNYLTNHNFHISFNCQMHFVDAFNKSVAAYPSIFIIEHNKGFEKNIICNSDFNKEDSDQLKEELMNKTTESSNNGAYFYIKKSIDFQVFPTIEETGVQIGIGIAIGKDSIYITDIPNLVEQQRMIPLAYAKDIVNYQFPDSPKRWLISPWENESLVNLDLYPLLKQYFLLHKEELCKRHVVKKNEKYWYRTIDKIKSGLLKSAKILLRDMSNKIEPIYDDGKLYPHHNLYWMTSNIWDLHALGGILLSEQVNELMTNNSIEMCGGLIRHQAQYLRKIRIPKFSAIDKESVILLKKAFAERNRDLATKIYDNLYKGEKLS